MLERDYQRELIGRIKQRFPECAILKPDPRDIQGVPDLLILYGDTWAMLEVKVTEDPQFEPNQLYYIEQFGGMSYVTFITPYNEEEVLNDLQQAFGSPRQACVPESQ